MKKIVFSLLLLSFAYSAKAAIIIPGKNPLASEIMIPLMGTNTSISLEAFVKMTPKEYKFITGKKLSFMERIKLKVSQHYGKKLIQKDGTADITQTKKFGFFDRWHWHWGGFALGFLIIIGPIIALFFKDDYKWDRFWTAMTVSSALVAVLTVLATSAFGEPLLKDID
jgi:hypothetical protein